jgi:hypothetical protein
MPVSPRLRYLIYIDPSSCTSNPFSAKSYYILPASAVYVPSEIQIAA